MQKKAIIFFAIYRYFLQFFELFLIICIVGNLSQDHKIHKFTVFYAFFWNAPKFTPFFVPHCKKFTVGQGKFYDGKFTMVNLKKGVNQKTGVKVRCLVGSIRAWLELGWRNVSFS
jgi:hypothetical protein